MKDSEKKEKKEGKNQKVHKKSIKLSEDSTIFFISCFHKELSDENLIQFYSPKEEIQSIEYQYSLELEIIPNHIPRVYLVRFRKELKRPKSLVLSVSFGTTTFYELNEFNLRDKKRFIFGDIKLIEKKIQRLINYINNDLNKNYIKRNNYCFNLEFEHKLSIYKNFIDKFYNDKKEKLTEYSENLAYDFLGVYKNNINKLNFSNAVNIFTLSYKNRNLFQFLDFSPKIVYYKDIINNNLFLEISNTYNTKKNEFFEPLSKITNTEKNEHYKKLMNDFMLTYIILYEKEKIINDKKFCLKAEKPLMKLINERNNITETTKLLNDYKELIYIIYIEKEKIKKENKDVNDKEKDKNKEKDERIKIKNKKDLNNINFEDFKKYYLAIVEFQKKNKKYFLDFTNMIERFIDLDSKNLMKLKALYFTFKYELSQKSNYNLRNKLNKTINKAGKEAFNLGILKNELLIDFISYNEIYLSNKKDKIHNGDFIRTYNDEYKKIKIIDILNGIDVNSKFDPIVAKIENAKIYKYFYNDMCGEYINIFTNKISDIQNLGVFFIILPKEYYNYNALINLKEWIYKNINTFSIKKCRTFKQDISNFIDILMKVANQYMDQFWDFLTQNLGEYCMELFIYILNKNNSLNQSIIEKAILYYISSASDFENYDLIYIDKIIYFIQHLEKEDNNILKIFYKEINIFTFNQKDFFNLEKSKRFELFEILLFNKKKLILNKTGDYLNSLKAICQTLNNKLKNLDLIYYEIQPLIINKEKNFLIERIKLLLFFLSNDENIGDNILEESNQIYNNIKKEIIKIFNNIKELGEASNYLGEFFSKNIKRLEQKKDIITFISDIRLKPIFKISSSKEVNEKLNSFRELIKEARQNTEKKKNSLLFVEIYRDNEKRIKDQEYLLEETCNNFISAINVILEDPENIQNNIFIKYFYEIGYSNEDNLNKEIDWLINYQDIKISEEKKNKFLSSLKILIKKQNIINIIKGMLIINDIYKDNIEETNEEKLYFDELKIKNDLLTKDISSNEIKQIINFISGKFKEITFDNNDKNYKKIILPFFNSFNKNQESFYFLKEKKIENIENLKEFLLDSDEREISLFDIDNFFKSIRFLNENINTIKSSFILIQTFISGVLNKDKFKCYLDIIDKQNKFKNLFEKFLKGEGGIFTKIRDIMNSSEFSITKKKEYEIKGEYIKTNNNNKEQKTIIINSDELDDLYQRIFISIKRADNESYVREFILFYQNIKALNNIINKLYIIYGYPNNIEIKMNIKNIELICNYEEKIYKLKDLIFLFKSLKKHCKNIFNKYIGQYNELRLFYGKQLYFINYHLQQKDYDKIKDLICCSTNGLIRRFNDNFYLDELKGDIYETMIKNIIKFIQEQLLYNNKKIEDIYLMNNILNNQNNKNNEHKGFYFFCSSIEDYDILTFYYNFTGRKPNNTNILYCNQDTSNEEIAMFMMRAIYCTLNSLFMIVIPEYLNNNQKSYIIKYLKGKSKKEAQMMNSCLIILFSLKDTEFHQSILKIKNINLINQTQKSIQNDENQIGIISSKICGLGKSTFIDNKNKNGKKIYLPIGGDMSKDDLIEIIKEKIPNNFNDESIKYILHINLTQTSEFDIVKDFLFKLLILKKCELKENVIYIRPNVQIFIEISNDFYNYLNIYKILAFFNEKPLLKINEHELILSRETKIVSTLLANLENNNILNNNLDIEKDCINNKNINRNIIFKYLDIKNPNFYQVNTFINVLTCEFEKFNQCMGFSPSLLKENAPFMEMNIQEALELRKLIIESLIKITRHFTIGPYEQLIKTQDKTQAFLNYEGDNNKINELLKIKIDSITYDDIKPSLVVFNNDGNSFTILTTCSENEEEFKQLEKLYNSQNIEYQKLRNYGLNKGNNIEKIAKLKNLKSLNSKDILSMLINFLDVNNLSEQEINNIIGNYVYTTDNFIKVILILLRIRARVPVIMMGETGCGKTTLIEMAFKLINKGKNSIKKLNIHAGTNDIDIINFIKKVNKEVDEEDKFLINKKIEEFYNSPIEQTKHYDEIQIFNQFKEEIYNRQIWIFFDEINTCNSMGLLSEILCNNTYRGNPINKRFVFIAACNPYRILLKERKMDAILIHKKAKKNKLVYSVNPLPHSLLNFVFNFGNLKKKDEEKYIESMAKNVTKLYFENHEINNEEKFFCDQLIKLQIECISIAQNFVKENNDVSVVSLREVNRFLIFFKFFVKFINNRNKNDDDFNGNNIQYSEKEIVTIYKNNKNNIFVYESAINLSLFICYYLRLPDKETRKQLEEKLNPFFNGEFLKIPSLEMDYVINNFIIPQGIAKNNALKENLFSALFCIVNKIPLIICGKPGRSKTLCIQILQNSLKGKEDSKSYLCKSFSQLIIYKIQGALNTKTENVVKVFKKARDMQKENNNDIHLVLMDEMGLAELSPNNPLKVTHFELENEEEKVSFVGITNWGLDASKMNRVIYIVVQEPDENDLIITAKEIVKSYDINKENYHEKYGTTFNYLCKAYYKFIEDKKSKNDENKNFHGSRDFYSLIKNVISDIIKNKKLLEDNNNNNETLYRICLKNIERNFGGLENSINEFKSYFIELLNGDRKDENIKEYELLNCLRDSLYDNESRYLLMISDSSISKDILNCMLDEINNKIYEDRKNEDNYINTSQGEKNIILRKKEIKTYIGSKFKADERNIYYCDEILYKIKCEMETENIIILKDLEIVYPSLYELFNRSFTNLQGVKFARLGKSNSLSLVNDNFKVIILVDKQNIPKEDPPFLNRFEKHIISFANILNNKLITIADEIYSVLKEITICLDNFKNNSGNILQNDKNKNNKIIPILSKNIKFINNEEVRGLIYLASKKNIKEKNEMIKFILEKITPTFTEDLMVIMQKFGFKAKNNEYYENILNIYKINYRYNLKNFIEQTQNKISIIYTFSFINDLLFYNNNEEINNKYFNERINKKSIKEIKISEINSINMIDKNIINFITENNYNLCIIRFREEDLIKLDDVHNLVNDYISKESNFNIIQDKEKKSKIFIILIHISRINELSIKKNQEFFKDYNNNLNKNLYISFLSQTPQYFIDNINNNYSNFLDVLTNSNENILLNTLENNNLISKEIVYTLRSFSYNIINKRNLFVKDKKIPLFKQNEEEMENEYTFICMNNYRRQLIYSIIMDKDLKKLIIKGIISLFKKEEDFIKVIFDKNIINKEDVDFMETLNIYIEQQTRFYLLKLIYLFDEKQILECFISNKNLFKSKLILEEINNYIDNIYNINNNKLNLDNININNKIKTRILFGLKIPFIQNIINNNIFGFIKTNISKDYIENEFIIMNKRITYENLDLEKNRYIEGNKRLENILKNELINYPFIKNILQSGDIQLIKDLFSDCFHVFLMKSNIFNDDYDSLIEILEIIIQIRLKTRLNDDLNIEFCSELDDNEIELVPSFLDLFVYDNKEQKDIIINEINEENNYIKDNEFDNNKDFYIDIFAKVVNFIESYSKEIYNILEIFYFFDKNIENKDCIKSIKNLIIHKKIKMETNERNPEYSQVNKICFFYIIESLLSQIISFLKKKNFYDIYKYFSKIKCYITNLFKIEKKLLLFSKELFTFEMMIKLFEYYEKIKNENKEEIRVSEYEVVIKTIMEGEELLLLKKYDELNDNIKLINNSLKVIFEEYSDQYCELMNSIIVNRYKLINNNKFRENLLKILVPEKHNLSNKKLLEKSYVLISLVLGKSEPDIYKEGEDKEKYKKKFLFFTTNLNDKNFSLKMILNKDYYPGLNEVIMYYYENCCQNYFDKIENELKKKDKDKKKEIDQNELCKELCENMSKIYLSLAINYIKDNNENNNIIKNNLNFLGKYYSIAYIKRYLDKYVNFLINNQYQLLYERTEINKILFSENTIISKEIKYYTLKLCLHMKNNNYDEFLNFFKEDSVFEFKEYFNDMKLEESNIFFYSLLPSFKNPDKNEHFDFNIYKEFYFKMKNRTTLPIKEFKKFNIKEILYTYLYFNFYKSYIGGFEDDEIKINLLSLFSIKQKDEEYNFRSLIFNGNSFNTKVLPKLGINISEQTNQKNQKKIEILFYSFRFLFSILYEGNSNNFYYSLLTKGSTQTINDNMIPGRLSNTNDYIKSFDLIKQNFKKDPNYAAYLCSCGYHYTIDYCSFPMREFPCPKCNQIIGGRNHILHRREGHKRIFFNSTFKDMNLSLSYADKDIPFIFLKDLENEINNKKNELFKGLKKEDKHYFLKRRAKIREMSYITFRILNFILHGFILYANIQGYIPDEYLKKHLIDSMTCFEIMEADWDIIDSELKIKQIPNVQIFMNIIFDRIVLAMKKQNNFNTDIKLNNFEKEIEDIIQNELTNQESIDEYIHNNNIMTDNVKILDKSIILENRIDKNYPDMIYFNITKLPQIESFKKEFNSLEENIDNYPIINYMIDKNSKIKYLQNLPIINELCNYLINYCSYRFTRDEAKTISIKKEITNLDKEIDKFIKIYNKLRPLIQNYECHELKDKKGNLYFNNLIDNQYLSNFCVDIGEFDYGMVLTAIYKEMINWQNQFINVVLNSKNSFHKNYSELFEREIKIQDCSKNDIIIFPSIEEVMNDIIIKNSYQKNYGVIIYNYELIEEELAFLILPSIKKFVSDNENCLRYVIYQFEGFRGNKSNIITRYIEKYKPKELNNDELKIIFNYKNKYEKNESKKLTGFLFALQIIMDIILENNYNKDELISNIVDINKENGNIDILKDLFNNDDDKNLFTIDTLMNVFNIFEIICWEKIKDNLIDSYLMNINDYIKNKFNSYYTNNNMLITKRKLATAIRRFISRYLTGKRGQNEINEKNNLKYYLSKQELWDENGFVDNEVFEIELNILFEDDGNNSVVCVGQATKLYEYLNGDESLLHEYFNKIKDCNPKNDNYKEEEAKENEDNPENKINEIEESEAEEDDESEENQSIDYL